jgi:cytosolic carboxypeptidase protein 5
VFKIVPIINPDGVARGHYRLDSLGQNLNRFYQEPDSLKQPTVFAIVEYIKYLHSEQRLKLYMDLHAHARKEGCFIYGNHSDDAIMKAEQMMYPKLISLNCRNFDFQNCVFTEKLMKMKDKREDKTREGAGRVAIYNHC